MSSDVPADTVTVLTEGAVEGEKKRERKCHLGDRHLHRDDVRKIWRECQEESFWYRALPISLGSMAVTGGLIYNGVWSASKRFGPFPKLAVAGILGYAVGKASYVKTCRNKFQTLGPVFGPEDAGFGPWVGPGFGGRRFGPGGPAGHRHCHHVCEECKRQQAPAVPADTAQS